MSAELPEKKEDSAFDVVLVHGTTEDGEGARVLRARPGRVEVGEVRPLRHGKPIAGGGEVVRLAPRGDTPQLYDVEVQVELPARASGSAPSGPAQVATPAYRESWERTFRPGSALN